MTHRHHFVLGVLTATAAMGATANAPAAQASQPPFGAHVSECARQALGERPGVPRVACEHDGHAHAFPTFGAMVAHLREHD